MRLVITMVSGQDRKVQDVYKHAIQGFIYKMLERTAYSGLHDAWGFKFFCFSDIFPISPFQEGKHKKLIISSPDEKFIKILGKACLATPRAHLGPVPIEITKVKTVKLRVTRSFITGSPVVLYKNNRKNLYFSFHKGDTVPYFLERALDNAVTKYNAYHGGNLEPNFPLFDRLTFKKEVAIKNVINGKEFLMIGSTWTRLEKVMIEPELFPFYTFLLDAGLGEKNSMGFGFLNPCQPA